MNVQVVPALPEQESVVANLLELYIYDFSELIELKLGPDGRFGYSGLSNYWRDPNRYPFLIRVNGDLAGFAFVQRGSEISGDPDVWDVAEFFIVRSYRRQNIGMKAAQAVWQRFSGKWEIRVMSRNQSAVGFWARAIEAYLRKPIASTPYEKNGNDWQLFSFESLS